MFEYEKWREMQIGSPKTIKKPLKYRMGERKALDEMFSLTPSYYKILDIGCGSGVGLAHLRDMGFTNLRGIDLNPKKVIMAQRKGLNVVEGDFMTYPFSDCFDVFWLSHSLEHMLDPKLALHRVRYLSKTYSDVFIVVPYPDLKPSPVHCASEVMGLNIDDGSKTFRRWIRDQKLVIDTFRYDDFREKEIWLMTHVSL